MPAPTPTAEVRPSSSEAVAAAAGSRLVAVDYGARSIDILTGAVIPRVELVPGRAPPSAAEVLRAIHAGEVSCVAVVTGLLQRIALASPAAGGVVV